MAEHRLKVARIAIPDADCERSWIIRERDELERKRAVWLDAINQSGPRIEARSPDWQRFTAARRYRRLGGASFYLTEVSPVELRAASDDLARPRGEARVVVLALLQGEMTVSQDGVDVALKPFDVVAFESPSLHRIHCPSPSQYVSLEMPADALNSGCAHRLKCSLGLLKGESLAGGAVTHMMRQAWRVSTLSGTQGRIFADQICRIIADGLAESDAMQGLTVHKLTMARRAKQLVRKSLHDPTYSVSDLACHMGVTTQYITDIFGQLNTTPSAYTRRLRLHMAFDALTNTGSSIHIAGLAQQLGFRDGAEFCRQLRKAYGTTPSQIRRTAWPA